ncbi:MAG: NADP-dependent oxidoreductase [Lactobacillaceae bacterium]|jgi:NADPH:quinone reductase-like Zn-dependent oxidoreductase|nr:NADP-dependent oxidoreductase [Lactobacillaceae bacterium]
MKAIAFKDFSEDYDVLEEIEIDRPAVGAGEILIEQKAVAIDPYDIKYRSGNFGKDVELPFVGGSPASGVVVEVGEGVTNFKVGDRAVAVPRKGGYAEYVVAVAEESGHIPDSVSFEEASALALGGQTGYQAVLDGLQVKDGEVVLIHGGAGSVGYTALQEALALGASKVYTTALPTDVDYLQELDPRVQAIDFTTQKFTDIVKDADKVLDVIGGGNLMGSIEVTKAGGRVESTVPLPDGAEEAAKEKGVEVNRFFMNSNGQYLTDMLEALVRGDLKVTIGRTEPFNLENLIEGQKVVLAQTMRGKFVLTF